MKKYNAFFNLGILSFILIMLVIGCKKKSETTVIPPVAVVPEFTITAVTVQLQAGGEGLQFSAKCSNTNVKMTNATFFAPVSAKQYVYDLNGSSFAKNVVFELQQSYHAYLKEPGLWQFTFVGNRTSDNESFTVNATYTATVK